MRNLGLVLLLAACGDDAQKSVDANLAVHDTPMTVVDADPRTIVAAVPVTVNRDVDVLFMIDDSPSMADKQANLKNNFPNFVNVLNTVPGGLPNLHLGVITSDLGVSAADGTVGASIGGTCVGKGKNGALHGGADVVGNFITDIKQPDGTRQKNYTGDLVTVFGELASVGQAGCAFEQPLEAVKQALNNNPVNAGFLRHDALLAIVFLTDEDDCSANHPNLFTADTATYGPLQSFRCTRFGVTCDTGGATPDAMNQLGTKSECHGSTTGTDLTKVEDYISFIKSLKADPSAITVAAIAGPTTPFAVENRPPMTGQPAIPSLAHSCTYQGLDNVEVADPAVRVNQLVAGFVGSAFTTICQQDLSTGLVEIAQVIGQRVGNPCLSQDIAQPADCQAFDEVGATETPIPPCPNLGGVCFSIVEDDASCPNSNQHLKLSVDRGSTSPAAGTTTVLKCKL